MTIQGRDVKGIEKGFPSGNFKGLLLKKGEGLVRPESPFLLEREPIAPHRRKPFFFLFFMIWTEKTS